MFWFFLLLAVSGGFMLGALAISWWANAQRPYVDRSPL